MNEKYIQLILRLKEELKEPKRIVITTHQGPDGDAIGSSLALYLFLKKQGHDVNVISPNDYPDFLQWLPCNSYVVNYMRQKPLAEGLIGKAEYIFHMDYNHLKRSADMVRTLAQAKAVRILIDHHPKPDMIVRYMFSEVTASSTCELLYLIMKHWDESSIDRDIATCIYTGIMTDTGSFGYRSATSETFMVAAKLMEYNIDRAGIYENVYDNFSVSRMKLMGYCLNNKMQVFLPFRTAIISLSISEQKQYDFLVGDSEGFVNLPLSIKNIRFTAFFLEKEDKIKISFRSRGDFSVNDFSRKHFGGGGHINAAGGDSRLSLDETVQAFCKLLPLYEKELNNL